MKLGELRKLTAHLGDDVEIITSSDNYELRNSWVESYGIRLVKVSKVTEDFRDDFDGTNYSKEVFVPDENGIEVLKI